MRIRISVKVKAEVKLKAKERVEIRAKVRIIVTVTVSVTVIKQQKTGWRSPSLFEGNRQVIIIRALYNNMQSVLKEKNY